MKKQPLILVRPYTTTDMAILEQTYNVHRLWEATDKVRFLRTFGSGVRVLATDGECGADAATMDLLPDLELIASFGVGLDAIDLAHARRRNIRVTHTPDVLTEDVADMALGLLLACARRIPQCDSFVRQGRWLEGSPELTTRVWGKRVGILGLGRVGRAVATRAEAFKLDVAYHDRCRFDDVHYQYFDDVVALAAEVDFLLICASADTDTRGLIGKQVLDALGRDGVLVNIGRGAIVDEPVLLTYLRESLIAGAALDVFHNEPNIAQEFKELDNVILQPHQASATRETRAAMGALVRENISAYFDDRPLITEFLRPTIKSHASTRATETPLGTCVP